MADIRLPKGFLLTADDIKAMRIRGAGKIARTAAGAIMDLAHSFTGDNLKEFKSYLDQGARHLLGTRPTAVSLRNALAFTLGRVEGNSVEKMKKSISKNAKEFIERSLTALEIIGKYGSRLIHDYDTLLTHCNSKASISAFLRAHKEGKSIRVFATETRPWNQGYLTVRELARNRIRVTLIVDSAVRFIIKDENVDSIFVGADTIHSDGSLANKIGTSQIALIANEAGIPFYVCAETFKFSPYSIRSEFAVIEERDPAEIVDPSMFPKVSFRNPVFDLTPARYITAMVTERGVVSPQEAHKIAEELQELVEWSL